MVVLIDAGASTGQTSMQYWCRREWLHGQCWSSHALILHCTKMCQRLKRCKDYAHIRCGTVLEKIFGGQGFEVAA